MLSGGKRVLIVTELRDEPAHVLTPGVLMAGASMAFSGELDRAYIASPFDPRVEYCQEEISGALVRITDGDRIGFEFARPPEPVGRLSRDVIPLNLLYPHNYFHFLIECLPSLLRLVQDGRAGADAMIASGILHPNMWTALHYALRRQPLPIVQLRPRQTVTCDRVMLPSPSWHATELMTGAVSDSTYDEANIRLVRDAFKPAWAAAADLKLFVRRCGGQRLMTNADEAERMAIAAGYRVIDPGALSFADQVRLFSAASRVIGPTGAWAANLIFTREEAKVTILYPATCKSEKTVWTSLGDICGVEIDELYCPVTRLNERQPIHSDFMVPPGDLASRLA